MEKYYEKEGMKSAGEATAKEVREGSYDAEWHEPEMSLEDYFNKPKFGGVVGRSEGWER